MHVRPSGNILIITSVNRSVGAAVVTGWIGIVKERSIKKCYAAAIVYHTRTG